MYILETSELKPWNCAQAEEKGQKGPLDGADEPPSPSVVGIPGLTAKSDWKPPPESQQEIVQFQKYQAEEKKAKEQDITLKCFVRVEATMWTSVSFFYPCIFRGWS